MTLDIVRKNGLGIVGKAPGQMDDDIGFANRLVDHGRIPYISPDISDRTVLFHLRGNFQPVQDFHPVPLP